MTDEDQPISGSDQALRLLAARETKLKGKWVSFKKVLRGDKTVDPDYASATFNQEKAKYEAAVELIEHEREQIIARGNHRPLIKLRNDTK